MGKRSKEEPVKEEEPVEEEPAEEPVLAKKKKKKKVRAAEAAVEAETEAVELPKKGKKEEAAAAEAGVEAEEAVPKKKKKKAKAAVEAAVQEEVAEEVAEEESVPKKKKKKKAAVAEVEDEEAEPVAKKSKTADDAAEDTADPEKLKVFVRGLPFSTEEATLRKDFEECGEIVDFGMPLNDEGQCRGIAFIGYATKAGFDKAIAFDSTDYGGRTIFVAPAGDKSKGKGKDGKGGDKGKGKDGKGHDNENTVFVRGLPFGTTEDVLTKDFGECGELVSLRMPLNEEGQCRGIAFAKYGSKEACDKAIEFNETDYGGRTIYVSMAGEGKGDKGKGKDGKGKDKGKNKGKKGK